MPKKVVYMLHKNLKIGKLILLVIFVTFTISTYGQENTKKNNFQFDLGTNISIPYKKHIEFYSVFPFNGSNKTDYSTNFGYFLEFSSLYNLNGKFFIASGINFSYTSIKIFEDILPFITTKGNLTNLYLKVPFIVKYKLLNNTSFFISSGAYLGFLVNAKEKGTTYLDTSKLVAYDPNDPLLQPEQNYNNKVNADFTQFDYGLLIQLEYEIKLGKHLTGNILTRFNYGLRNVISTGINKKEMEHSAAFVWKNYEALIGIGIKI